MLSPYVEAQHRHEQLATAVRRANRRTSNDLWAWYLFATCLATLTGNTIWNYNAVGVTFREWKSEVSIPVVLAGVIGIVFSPMLLTLFYTRMTFSGSKLLVTSYAILVGVLAAFLFAVNVEVCWFFGLISFMTFLSRPSETTFAVNQTACRFFVRHWGLFALDAVGRLFTVLFAVVVFSALPSGLMLVLAILFVPWLWYTCTGLPRYVGTLLATYEHTFGGADGAFGFASGRAWVQRGTICVYSLINGVTTLLWFATYLATSDGDGDGLIVALLKVFGRAMADIAAEIVQRFSNLAVTRAAFSGESFMVSAGEMQAKIQANEALYRRLTSVDLTLVILPSALLLSAVGIAAVAPVSMMPMMGTLLAAMATTIVSTGSVQNAVQCYKDSTFFCATEEPLLVMAKENNIRGLLYDMADPNPNAPR